MQSLSISAHFGCFWRGNCVKKQKTKTKHAFACSTGGFYCLSSRSEVCAEVSEASTAWRAGGDRAQPGREKKRESLH